ncbi:MAG: TlpA family protein disulfide reductase, partial [Planctomycetota bacterium]
MRPPRSTTPCRMPPPRAAASLCVLAACTLSLTLTTPLRAVTHLKAGATPPPIALETLAGERFSLEGALGRPLVVVFGELYHQKTLEACGDLREALASDVLAPSAITTVLVIAQDATKEQLRGRASDPRLPATIVHDAGRKAYGDYRVTVMPSAVVIDDKGRVVHAVAGYSARFRDIVTDALLVALGKLTREAFEARLHPTGGTPVDEARIRASRLASLARQLSRRGLDAMAREKYDEALELAPDYVPA